MQSRWAWASSTLAFIGVCWSSACGGTSSETVVNQSAAGQPAGSECELGETRECVGRGACKGGQQCTKAGWSECDCGDANNGGMSGTANVGDGGTSSGATGTVSGGAPNGGEVTSGGEFTGGVTGVAGEGSSQGIGGDGTMDWQADPCPEPRGMCTNGSLYNAYDCAGDCPSLCDGFCPLSKDSPCTFEYGAGGLGDLQGREVPTYVTRRMSPAAPFAGSCSCAHGKAVVVRWLGGTWNSHRTHMWINRPWHIGPPRADTCVPPERSQCFNLPTKMPEFSEALQDYTFQVWTDDPNAPAANVYIGAAACPQ